MDFMGPGFSTQFGFLCDGRVLLVKKKHAEELCGTVRRQGKGFYNDEQPWKSKYNLHYNET